MNNNFKNKVSNTQILQQFEEVKKLTEKMIKELEKEEFNLKSNQVNDFDYLPISKIHENYNYEKGTYKVRESWIEPDKNSGILKNGVYLKNPTATTLKEFILINDKLHWPLGSKNENQVVKESFKFLIDENGNVILGLPEPYGKAGLHYFHPTLLGCENPEVITAGQIDFVNGKAVLINNVSGHFKPYSTTKILIKIAFENVPKSEGYFSYQFVD